MYKKLHITIYVSDIKGTFEGIAVYKQMVNRGVVKESHIVNGTFQYNVPQ
ncbi:hypothetical protein DFQ11_105163 [Winogradskyella epiphytica]|uniref:Uncharacterized protein n=1 Tax=Winogradskyella epiphytica TaxID=262005 RepID=A0A2V4XDU2_9FLAO|nr:hypothetical protein [Winogradskyella epiphytica]PYE80564.1 hypothetical protein DFQ11_105163 [Winogradskyella epiphytica]GGW68595.1 hypothetical protein GCM10008085_20540 [Winogradskyella epiphytica]